MNDQRNTKKQLLEDLQRERERSIALQEVSNKVAAAYNTDEALNVIAKEAARPFRLYPPVSRERI